MSNSERDEQDRWKDIAEALGTESGDEILDYFAGTTPRTTDEQGPVEFEVEVVEPIEEIEQVDTGAAEIVETVVEVDDAPAAASAGFADDSDDTATVASATTPSESTPEAAGTPDQPSVQLDSQDHWSDLAGELGIEVQPGEWVELDSGAEDNDRPDEVSDGEPQVMEIQSTAKSSPAKFEHDDSLGFGGSVESLPEQDDSPAVLDQMFVPAPETELPADEPEPRMVDDVSGFSKGESGPGVVVDEDSIEFEVEDLAESDHQSEERRRQRKQRRTRRSRSASDEGVSTERDAADNAVEDNAVEDNAVEDNAVEDNAVEDNAVEDNAVEDNAVEDNAADDDGSDNESSEDYQDTGFAAGLDVEPTGREKPQSRVDRKRKKPARRRSTRSDDAPPADESKPSRPRRRPERESVSEDHDEDHDEDPEEDHEEDHDEEVSSARKKKAKKNIPTWSEAVETIVNTNISQRKKSSGSRRRRNRNN